jgi:hypothetical protein
VQRKENGPRSAGTPNTLIETRKHRKSLGADSLFYHDWREMSWRCGYEANSLAAGWCCVRCGGTVFPKFRGWHDEFDGHLRLAHEAGAEARDAAEQFFLRATVLDTDDLLERHGSGEQDQRAMRVDDDGVSLFLDGVLLGVLEADQYGNADVNTFAAPAILRRQVVWMDGHLDKVAIPRWLLNADQRAVP